MKWEEDKIIKDNNLFYSLNVISITKQREDRMMLHVAQVRKNNNQYKGFI